MPKRPNPFGDCAPLQFKTHVGMKEIDCGVRHDELMKGVYEKTRQKLFSGAHIDINDNHMARSVKQPVEDSAAALCLDPAQSRLDSSGHLVTPSINGPFCGQQNSLSLLGFNLHQGKTNNGLPTVAPAVLTPGQLCLDSNGQLMAAMDCDSNSCGPCPETGICDKSVDPMQGLGRFGFKSSKQASCKSDSVAACQACRRPLAKVHVKCHFCEKGVCMGCVRQCDTCNYTFCQVCTTLNYDEALEKAFCLTCIGY